MLKILLGVFLTVAAVVAVVVVLGAISPRDHVATGEAIVDKPIETTAALVRDVGGYPRWRESVAVTDVRPDAEGVLYRETSGGDAVDYRLAETTPGERFQNTILSKDLPWGGYWVIELEPAGTGTRVRVTEHGHVDNLVFRALSRFVFRHDSSLKAYLKALAAA